MIRAANWRARTGLVALAVLAGCGGGATSYPMRSKGGVRFGAFALEADWVHCSGGASSGPGELFDFHFTLASDASIASLTGISIPPFATRLWKSLDSSDFEPCAAAPWTGSPQTGEIELRFANCESEEFISVAYSCGVAGETGRGTTYDPPPSIDRSGTATLELSGLLSSGATWSTEVDFPYSF